RGDARHGARIAHAARPVGAEDGAQKVYRPVAPGLAAAAAVAGVGPPGPRGGAAPADGSGGSSGDRRDAAAARAARDLRGAVVREPVAAGPRPGVQRVGQPAVPAAARRRGRQWVPGPGRRARVQARLSVGGRPPEPPLCGPRAARAAPRVLDALLL
ncbi:hypothetical protein H4R21_006820, partial [Coemansia helicoidea]